jgi:hypothetical protein
LEKEEPSKVEKAKEAVKAAIQPRKLPKSQFDGVADDYYDALKPIFAPEKKTIVDKIDGMRDDFWRKLAQGIADQYRTIKDYSEEAYMKARMSKTIDGALEGILFNGEVKLTDGALDIAKDTKGLLKVLEPIGNEVDRYQIWVALNRDAQLVKQGKAPSVNKDLVARRNELAAGKIGNKSRLEVYQQVQKDMNKLNRSVLKYRCPGRASSTKRRTRSTPVTSTTFRSTKSWTRTVMCSLPLPSQGWSASTSQRR